MGLQIFGTADKGIIDCLKAVKEEKLEFQGEGLAPAVELSSQGSDMGGKLVNGFMRALGQGCSLEKGGDDSQRR